jgi:hypothetical protein
MKAMSECIAARGSPTAAPTILSSAHHHATIHLQYLASDIACGWIGCKKADDAGYFFCATHSAKGDRAKDCFAFQFFGHVSGYKSWSNSINGHTSAGEFSGRTAG